MPEPTPPSSEDALPDDLPEQIRVRRDKRERLIEKGIAPYPVRVECTHSLADINSAYDAAALGPDHETGDKVAVVGRVIFLRNTGKLCFVRLRSGDGGELQAMLSQAVVGAESLADFKSLVDIGDLIAVQGEVVTSRRGELSVQTSSWQIAAKALRPLPNEHRPLTDETRMRLRYVDMIVRPHIRQIAHTKAAVLRSLRATLDESGFLEVETPVLQRTNGGASARPFRTHLNAFGQDMLLRIAEELHLKRAMVGGLDRVYEIGRIFRNEGIDSTHAPEFSMLEAYQAYSDYHTMQDLLRLLVMNAAEVTGVTSVTAHDGAEIQLTGEWRTAKLLDLVSAAIGDEVSTQTPPADLRRHAERRGVHLEPEWGNAEILVELFEKLVQGTLVQPTFVCDFPRSLKPLAKPCADDSTLSETFDLIVGGVELAMANSELNDPVIQRDLLVEQAVLAAQGDPEAMELDEDFLRAMEFGMPPAGGLGMGVDRLVMLLTGVGIRESILFPLLRPE